MPENARYRCNACGNLTRFNVVLRRRTQEFWHFSLGGDVTIEDFETLEENVERIECRWCGSADQIEAIPRVGIDEDATQ